MAAVDRLLGGLALDRVFTALTHGGSDKAIIAGSGESPVNAAKVPSGHRR